MPRIVLGDWTTLRPQAEAVRRRVFVIEQHVPPEMELDDADPVCVHAVATDEAGSPVGTGRLLPDGHIGRMAVLAGHRGAGIGSAILAALMDHARQRGDAAVVLNAQVQAADFYARHGFMREGEVFMDAGIPHIAMRRRFN